MRALVDTGTLLLIFFGPWLAVIALGHRNIAETGNALGASIVLYILVSSFLLLALLRPHIWAWLLG